MPVPETHQHHMHLVTFMGQDGNFQQFLQMLQQLLTKLLIET
jgi:hypothetical protein